MTRMIPLLERNEQFARTYTPVPLGPPTSQVLIVTCLDHRVDPAILFGLRLGDAPVIRNVFIIKGRYAYGMLAGDAASTG